MRENTKDKKFVVYIHRNLVNGKVYIGQTCNLSERWRCNGKNYLNSTKFYNAIKKYGWDNFSHEVLYDNLNQEAADIIEKELIEKYDSINNGYNLKEGGARGVLSKNSLKKLGDSIRKGFAEHPERGLKIRAALLGRKGTPKESRVKSLHNRKFILIEIDGEIGSTNYWAKRAKTSKRKLRQIKEIYGIAGVIDFLRKRIILDTEGLRWIYKKE